MDDASFADESLKFPSNPGISLVFVIGHHLADSTMKN